MAKKIILLSKMNNLISPIRIAFWAEVPLGRQAGFATPGLKSVWAGASQAENDAIEAGQISETTMFITPPFGSTTQTLNDYILAKWQEYQDQITNTTISFRPGTYYDGTWHLA